MEGHFQVCLNEKVDYVLRLLRVYTMYSFWPVEGIKINARAFGMTFDPSTEISNFTKERSSFCPIISGGCRILPKGERVLIIKNVE